MISSQSSRVLSDCTGSEGHGLRTQSRGAPRDRAGLRGVARAGGLEDDRRAALVRRLRRDDPQRHGAARRRRAHRRPAHVVRPHPHRQGLPGVRRPAHRRAPAHRRPASRHRDVPRRVERPRRAARAHRATASPSSPISSRSCSTRSFSSARVRHVELVSLAPTRVLCILIADSGQVEQRLAELDHPVDDETPRRAPRAAQRPRRRARRMAMPRPLLSGEIDGGRPPPRRRCCTRSRPRSPSRRAPSAPTAWSWQAPRTSCAPSRTSPGASSASSRPSRSRSCC